MAVAAYREDLTLIADDSSLIAFDSARGAARVDVLRRLWSDRDRQALRAEGARLREHYRRLTHAERRFGLEVNRRHYSASDMYRSGSTRFDDRGVVYIRYGDPDNRVLSVTMNIQPNETWRYHRADGDFLLHFAANAGGDIHDLRLIPSVATIGGVDPSDGNTAATAFAFLDRCEIHETYCKYLNWSPWRQERALRDERDWVRASVSWAVSTDGYELHFAHGLLAATKAFAVGRADGGQLVHVAYQVALVPPDSLTGGTVFRLPLRVRVNLVDSAGHSGGWVDTTTVVLMPGGGPSTTALDAVGRVTLTVPSGRWRYQVALAYDDSTGRVLPTDSLVVGRFDGSRLAVSDLILSKGGRGAPWVPTPGDTAYFNPRTTWTRRDTLALYHEIYGLRDGSTYRAKLVLRRSKRVALSLLWEGQASEITRVTRTLSFEAVKSGDYTLEVEITGEDGQRAASRRDIRITGKGT
jgi:GWxTD domain-containing protein